MNTKYHQSTDFQVLQMYPIYSTALASACEGREEAVETLLEQSADVNGASENIL